MGDTVSAGHMVGMLSNKDLEKIIPGLTAPSAESDGDLVAVDDGPQPAPLVPGSPTAAALWHAWSGIEVTVVDAPPGSGKSELVATVLAHLATRTDLKVVVATPTRAQAIAVAARCTGQVEASKVFVAVSGLTDTELPPGTTLASPSSPSLGLGRGSITVRTLASCQASPPTADVFVVDEAYQSTHAQVLMACAEARQVMLVGDPGQIGPVITVDTTTWNRQATGPHKRAPEAFIRRADAQRITLPASFRLGQPTVDALSGLYDFAFVSARPDRELVGMDELTHRRLPPCSDPYDQVTLRVVADRAQALVGTTLVEAPGRGEPGGTRVLTPADVGVVVSHNGQVSVINGMLRGAGACFADIAVGTADRLQGGQWHAVVALDPFIGYEGLSPHAMSLGRLCVMASRHRTHLTWVHDGRWNTHLSGSTDVPGAEAALAVRRALTSG